MKARKWWDRRRGRERCGRVGELGEVDATDELGVGGSEVCSF